MAREKVIYKIDIEKNQKAIKRNRRNKLIGKVLATAFVLIFVGSIVGVTVFSYNTAASIWWQQVGEEANVEFKELFTLFNGVNDTNESKIVTNGYSDDDLQGFYSNIKRKLYLADDYDLSISKIISSVMAATSGGLENGEQTPELSTIGVDGYDLQYVYFDAQGNEVYLDNEIDVEDTPSGGEPSVDDETGNEENSSLTGNEQLDKLLQELKFDFSSLAEYDGGSNVLEITDKQIASAIDDALSALSESFDALKDFETKIGKPIKDVMKVKQIIISGNELDAKATSFKITLSVKVKDLLSNILAENNLPPILASILPKELYATATVYPNDATKAVQASINRMGEDKIDKIVRIADVILKKVGNATSIGDLLVQVNSKVVEVINEAQQKVPIAFVPTGSIDIHPIETMINLLGVEISESAFLTMIRDIKLPTADSLGIKILSAEEKLDRTAGFINELSAKYCLDNSSGKITPQNTIGDIIKLAEGDDILNSVQLANMKYAEQYNPQGLKVRTEYSALAAMLSDYVEKEGMLGDVKADIVGMSYTAKGAILSVDIKIDVARMLGFDGNGAMMALISQLVPNEIFVSANICVATQLNTPTTVEINKVGVENSLQHLQTLTALADKFGMDVSSLNYDELCAKVDDGIREGLSKIQEKIGCEIVFSEDCAYLPNLFEVVCGTGMLDESEEKKIQPESLYTIMKQANTYELSAQEQNKSKDANGFIGELESKYYLQNGKIVDNGDGKLLDDVIALKDDIGGAINKSALASDGRATDVIYPLLSEGEFAYLMGYKIKLDELSDVLKSADILGATSTQTELRLHIGAKLYEDAPKSTQGEGQGESQPSEKDDLSKYSNLLPQNVYVTVIIDTASILAGSQNSCAKVVIDGMSDESMDDFFSIVRKLTGKSTNIEEIESNIDEQVKEYLTGIEEIDYDFVDGGLRIDNIFNVISKSEIVKPKTEQEHEFTAEEIRTLLRKLYGYDYSAEGRGDFTPAESLDNFIDKELHDKFFISDSFSAKLREYDAKDQLLDGFGSIGGDEFSVDKMRIDDLTSLANVTLIDGKSDTQIKEEVDGKFKPKFTAEEFAHLLSTQIKAVSDISFLKNQEIAFVGNDEATMTLTLKGKGNIEDEKANGLMPEDLYINLTIELGDILINGKRTDMNVHKMDINSVEYVDGGGAEQDLHLLITFIERIRANSSDGDQQPPQEQNPSQEEEISLEGILTDLEENLNTFKDKIHNEVFTVSFLGRGGFMFNETIYQIALNSVYGTKANEVVQTTSVMTDEINFRNGLCKINNMPSKFVNQDGVVIDFENGNRADDTSNSIAQINDKYALAEPLQGDETSILTVLGGYAKNYATNIDGVKLTSEEKRKLEVKDLRPEINGEELILMLEKSVVIEADGYDNAIMTAMYIRNNSMIIVYQSGITLDAENNKYNELVPKKVSLVVSVDIAKMNIADALCADIGINDLEEEEVGAIEGFISRLNASDGNTQNLSDANKQCSDNVRKTMKELTDNLHVDFVADGTVDGVTGGGAMILDSIYEIASDKINLMSEGEDEVSPQDIKDTLEALHENLDISAYQPPKDLTKDQMKVTYAYQESFRKSTNLFLSADPLNMTAHINGAIGGWNIASMINTDDLLGPLGLDENAAGKDDALLLKHTALIPTVANGDGSFNDMRAKLGALGDDEYFLITLDMRSEVAAGVDMTILPKRIDLTLYMDITNQKVSVLYNAMSEIHRLILSRLVKTSRPEGVGGIDLSETETVKNKILEIEIINTNIMGVQCTLTLGQVLSSGGTILPIEVAKSLVERNENVILGMGAIVIDM